MTLAELKQHFETLKAMILAEKAMRRRVFQDKPELAAKLAECDGAMAAAVAIKDELKGRLAGAVQPPLIAGVSQPEKRRY